MELVADGVTVNAVAPGTIYTAASTVTPIATAEVLQSIKDARLAPPATAAVPHHDCRSKNRARHIWQELGQHVLAKFLSARIRVVVRTRPIYCRIFADNFVLPLAGNRKPYPLLQTDATENWATFSPNGKVILTASADGTARQYLANYTDLMSLAATRVTRDFTPEERATYLGEALPTPTATGK